MSGKTPPEITLELSGGTLVIHAPEAVYRLKVSDLAQSPPPAQAEQTLPALPEAQAAPEAPAPVADAPAPQPVDETPAPPEAALPAPDIYHRELSYDMYREMGRLARRLGVSLADAGGPDGQPGLKSQLAKLAEASESAGERLGELCGQGGSAVERAQELLAQIRTQAEAAPEPAPQDGPAAQAREELERVLSQATDFLARAGENRLDELAGRAQAVKDELDALAQSEPEALPDEAPAQPAAYQFPLGLVFQTVYELCTNDTVKKHIKAMWEAEAKAFDQTRLEADLNQLVTDGPSEDNFLNLDVKSVLTALYGATDTERFKHVLKKMASTADQIFLETTLPLDAIPEEPTDEAEAAQEEPITTPVIGPEILERLEVLAGDLRQAGQELIPPAWPESWPELVEKALAPAQLETPDHSEALAQLEEALQGLSSTWAEIAQTASHQDESARALSKTIRLLDDFQLQLLAMLASFGAKLRGKEEDEEITPEQGERLAQEKVEEILGALGARESDGDDPKKPDQEAIDRILEDLGF